MPGKEVPCRLEDIYSNNKGYTHEQIEDFITHRAATMFLAIMQDDGADVDPQSGEIFFSKRQKRRAAFEQEMRDDPELAKEVEAFEACFVINRQTQTPPEPEMLFDRIHRGKYVYISKEGKTRTKKIVFPPF